MISLILQFLAAYMVLNFGVSITSVVLDKKIMKELKENGLKDNMYSDYNSFLSFITYFLLIAVNLGILSENFDKYIDFDLYVKKGLANGQIERVNMIKSYRKTDGKEGAFVPKKVENKMLTKLRMLMERIQELSTVEGFKKVNDILKELEIATSIDGTVSVSEVKSYIANLENYLLFNVRDINYIIEYINSKKIDLEDNFLNQKNNPSLTLEKLEKLVEVILQEESKDFNKEEILKQLAYLYIYKIYECRDTITLSNLKGTLFEQFLLGYVSLNIKEMIMQGIIIDNNMPLDNLETILNFLKNMRFEEDKKIGSLKTNNRK